MAQEERENNQPGGGVNTPGDQEKEGNQKGKKEQDLALFKKLFPSGVVGLEETERAADKIIAWASEIREREGDVVVEIPHKITPLTTTILISPEENQFLIAVVEKTETSDLSLVSGTYLILENLRTSVGGKKEGEYVMLFDASRGLVLKIFQSGELTLFGDGPIRRIPKDRSR